MSESINFINFNNEELKNNQNQLYMSFKQLFNEWFNYNNEDLDSFRNRICQYISIDIVEKLKKEYDYFLKGSINGLSTQDQTMYIFILQIFGNLFETVHELQKNNFMVDGTRHEFEFWFNYGKFNMDEKLIKNELEKWRHNIARLTNSTKDLIKFISYYQELKEIDSWKNLYIFIFSNILNNYEIISKRPKMRDMNYWINLSSV